MGVALNGATKSASSHLPGEAERKFFDNFKSPIPSEPIAKRNLSLGFQRTDYKWSEPHPG
jgi:hypothetical protein